MKLYLDNCCFNRPYDDQSNLRIRLESEAKLRIQEEIRSGAYKLVWSYILDYENSRNPFRERREQIAKWRLYAIEDIAESKEVLGSAEMLREYGMKKLDSLHLACAIHAGAEYFRIADPIEFIKEVLA